MELIDTVIIANNNNVTLQYEEASAMRRGDENSEKLIMVGNTEGNRSCGRSSTRWTDQVRDLSAFKLYTVIREGLDRNQRKYPLQTFPCLPRLPDMSYRLREIFKINIF
ncbi:uncharacterized protein LOC123720787 [Pieris brassicae]|uniref:uncharacterized protein LOC123720787 n=1 Tax=Pieris brassicae TaxID=7116 RepID=UPI001E66289A|nr:uncharacterized protein LOC123720787 [Pieris brassicae]